MCMRPDRSSVPTSVRALQEAMVAMLVTSGVLLLAVCSAPARVLRRHRPLQLGPATVAHVDVQVHLEDTKCVAELKRVIRQTLRRAARTWAPLPMPIDRVVVGVGFPPAGKVDLYAEFPGRRADATDSSASRPLTVVSLGLRDGDRELEPAEVAGALAAQIQVVIDERYRQGGDTTVTVTAPLTARTTVATRPAQPGPRPTQAAPPVVSQPAPRAYGTGLADPGVPRLQELIATVQQGQPLEAAGPMTNHTNP
jgi:hypothetical protein